MVQRHINAPYLPRLHSTTYVVQNYYNIYKAMIFFRCNIGSEQAISAERDSGVCEIGQVCSEGIGYLHYQRDAIWTDLHSTCSVST